MSADRQPRSSVTLLIVRYVLPVAIAVAGVVVAVVGDSPAADGMGAGLIGAAALVVLLNVFMRLGVQSGRDRDREQQARDYFDRHGRWPGGRGGGGT